MFVCFWTLPFFLVELYLGIFEPFGLKNYLQITTEMLEKKATKQYVVWEK